MSEIEKGINIGLISVEEESNREYHVFIIGDGSFIGTSSNIVRAIIAGHIDVGQISIEELDTDPRIELFAKALVLPEMPTLIPLNEMLHYVEYLEVDELDITRKDFISKKTSSKEVYQALKQTYIRNYQMLNNYENTEIRVGAKRLQKLR